MAIRESNTVTMLLDMARATRRRETLSAWLGLIHRIARYMRYTYCRNSRMRHLRVVSRVYVRVRVVSTLAFSHP